MTRPRPRTASVTTPKVRASIDVRNALLARGPDDWFNDDEAAVYLELAPRTLRNARTARTLVPDGRSGRRPVYRRRTLDAFLAARAVRS